MKKKTLVILAAGMGTRYGGNKQTCGFGPNDEMLMDYSIYDAIKSGFNKIVFVIREEFFSDFKKNIDDKWGGKAEFLHVFQSNDSFCSNKEWSKNRTKPWGTGHAILCCKNYVNEPFAVINADDFYGIRSFQLAYEFLQTKCSEKLYGLISYNLKQTVSKYGFVSRGICFINKDSNELSHIKETHKIFTKKGKILTTANGREIEIEADTKVSMNLFCFHNNIFNGMEAEFTNFIQENHSDSTSEFLIPAYIDKCIKDEIVKVIVENTSEKWFGVTYKKDKTNVKKEIVRLIKSGKYPTKF